jgi:hypothetical protein
MASKYKLNLFNPSPYSRAGFFNVPWHEIEAATGIKENQLILRDKTGAPLTFQIDDVAPDDPSRKTLVFAVTQPLAAGTEDYSKCSGFATLERKTPEYQSSGEAPSIDPSLDAQQFIENGTIHGVQLKNSRMTIWLNLIPEPFGDGRDWFSGAASSIVLDGEEILDAFQALHGWKGHDPEKRALQLNRVMLSRPAWEETLSDNIALFNKPYRFVSKSTTSRVRASVTIAQPFSYKYRDLTNSSDIELKCELYRIISLYAQSDFIIEELYIQGSLDNGGKPIIFPLTFAAHYFLYMNMGYNPAIYSFPDIPDWFAIGFPWGQPIGFPWNPEFVIPSREPHPGFGFATDVHAGTVEYPHPDFPDAPTRNRTFSWWLHPAKAAKCLHLFMRGHPAGFDARIGHYWYEFIYKPLLAKVAKAGENCE